MSTPSELADGRYLLVKLLGEGGMAKVYRAYDQRLGVWRAIKVLSAEFAANPKSRQRFEAEARTMALLEHPNLVRVYDIGNDGPWAYLVMELVECGALVDWIERHGPMPPRLAVDVTIATCEGLAAAHAKGVVHRDIKPHNVMIGRDGVCRVTDFGIAQVNTPDQAVTRTGQVMGTWGYMAPEQRTNAKGVDARADVYSAAAMLYTLVTNQLPMDLFAAAGDDDMLKGVPPALVPVLVKATEYKREARYDTILDLAAALRTAREALPADPPGTPPLAVDPGPQPTPPPAGSVARPRAPAPADSTPPVGTIDLEEAPGLGVANVAKVVFVAGWGAALVVLLVGVGFVALAAAVYALKAPSGVAVAEAPPGTSAEVPAALPAPDVPPPVAPAAPGTAEPVPASPPAEPKAAAPKPRPKPREPEPVAAPPPPEPAREPVTVVVTPPPPPPTAQCVKASPPASAAIGADLVLKATLCAEDGTPVTLWFRPVGGAWQSKLMPKALGAHTTKVPIDATFGAGLEFYVEAGGVTDGSRAAPYTVSVR